MISSRPCWNWSASRTTGLFCVNAAPARPLPRPALERADVIIVNDIYDTGMTLRFLVDRLRNLGAKSVKVCVLINKKERRTESFEADYRGFEVGEGFVVGYGLDYKEGYRNLPGIYMLHED